MPVLQRSTYPLVTSDKRNRTMIAKTVAATVIATAMLACGAHATDASFKPHRTDIRFHWQPAENKVTVTYYTGCISAHRGVRLQDDIQAYLDRDYLQFDLQGSYQVAPGTGGKTGKVGPADCMGSRQKVVEFTDVERETYVVNRHGFLDRNITLADQELEFTITDKTHANVKRNKPAMFLVAE